MGLSEPIFSTPLAYLKSRQPDQPTFFFMPHILDQTARNFTDGFTGLVSYAVKANPDIAVIDNLIAAGITTFDVASPHEIQREPDAEALSLSTDLDRLSQVFINLVTNARKYCDAPAPVLHIRPRAKNGILTVDFIDNGTGIGEKDRSIVFEKFSRLSDASAAGSAGLGLAICREIMRNLGGAIEYLPGQGGAAFRVTLPLDA